MSLCMVRILYGIRLRWVLLVCYAIVFALAAFTDKNFLSIAFDSGGVTTRTDDRAVHPRARSRRIKYRSDSGAKADSFGLVALCSIGPILAVLILGLFTATAPALRSSRRFPREHDRDRLGVSRRDPGVP